MGDSNLPDLTKWREIAAIAESQRQKNLVYKKKEQVFFDKVTNSSSKLKNLKFTNMLIVPETLILVIKENILVSNDFLCKNIDLGGKPKASSLAKGKVLGYEKGKRVYGI